MSTTNKNKKVKVMRDRSPTARDAVNDKAVRQGLELRHSGELFVLAHVGLTLQEANDVLDRLASLPVPVRT